MIIVPISQKAARRWIAEHHRHSGPVQSWTFGCGLMLGDDLIGVGVADRPVARNLADGKTIEIRRICLIEGAPRNAASMLYGALCRAATALGYQRAITYTLASEAGTSVRAAGFAPAAELPRTKTWARPSRPRYGTTIWGDPVVDPQPRVRWERQLAKLSTESAAS